MKTKFRKYYRKLFSSSTTHKGLNITSLSDDEYRNKDYNFHFISSASLTLISATFFIGLLSVNIKSISSLAYIELLLSMLFFAISITINSFSLFCLYMALNDEEDKTKLLIIFKYKFFAAMKLISILSPALAMFFLIAYFNEYIAILVLALLIFLLYCYGLVIDRTSRKANNVLHKYPRNSRVFYI